VASAVGLGLGFGSALALRALVQASGTPLPSGPLQLHWSSAVICLATGTGVAVVASVIPAEQAGRVPALVALRQDPVAEATMSHPVRQPVGAVMALLGAGLVTVGLVAPAPALVVAGALLLVLGLAGLGQAPVAASARVLGWPVARLCGFAGSLGRQNAVRHPRRTAASSASVVVGVALICALAVIASSAHTSADDQLSQTVLSDYVLMAAGSGPASGGPAVVEPLPPGVVTGLRAEPRIGAVSSMSYLTFHVDGHGTDWGAAVDTSNFTRMVGLGRVQGSLGGLRTGGVAVEQSLAAGRGWHLGQVLSFVFPAQDGADVPTRSRRPITALFDSLGYYGGFLFSAATLTAVYPDLPPSIVFVDGAPGAGAAVARTAVARSLAGYPEVSVSDPAQVQAAQDQAINRQIDLVTVLSLLALIIGYLGIVTNLMLSVTERVREIGLLRAVGLSTRQLGAALRFESAIIAALGALVGAVLGVFGAWTLQRSLASDGLTTLAVPWPTLIAYVALAVLVGVVAGVLPARQAARVPVLEALAEE
jgi:putative ABC transport system permease protein